MVLAGGCSKLVDKPPELDKSLDRYQRFVSHIDHRTSDLIEHPTRHNDPQFGIEGTLNINVLNPHQDRRDSVSICPAKDRHVSMKERVKTIKDPSRPELVGSVWIRYATVTRPACSKRAWTC